MKPRERGGVVDLARATILSVHIPSPIPPPLCLPHLISVLVLYLAWHLRDETSRAGRRRRSSSGHHSVSPHSFTHSSSIMSPSSYFGFGLVSSLAPAR